MLFSKDCFAFQGIGNKGGATGWTGMDMSTPLSSGRYSFLSKIDIKIVRYTFWPSIPSLFHPIFSRLAPPLIGNNYVAMCSFAFQISKYHRHHVHSSFSKVCCTSSIPRPALIGNYSGIQKIKKLQEEIRGHFKVEKLCQSLVMCCRSDCFGEWR